jgi:hypothetical protein
MMAVAPNPHDHWPDDDSGDESVSPDEGRTFFSTWGWPLFGLAAFVIFELTASLMWSSLVFALRFGWKDAYAGWYFWKRDTSPARGVASGLLYLTSATSQVLTAGFGVMMLFTTFLSANGRPLVPQIESAMIAMAILFLGGMLSAGLCGTAAVIVCRWSGRRVWVDGESYRQALHGVWPPPDCTTNRCDFICFLAMIPLTGLYLCLSLGLLVLLEWMNFGNGNQPVWMFFLWPVPVIGILPFFYGGRYWTVQSVCADRPAECWPELLPHRVSR